MDYIIYFFVFLVVCIVWFFIVRIWVSGIDFIIYIFKKIFGINNNTKNWHSLKDIKNKNKKDKKQ